jgi:hypothetical protein
MNTRDSHHRATETLKNEPIFMERRLVRRLVRHSISAGGSISEVGRPGGQSLGIYKLSD